MLTGLRAFNRESAVETMSAILKEEPPEFLDSGRKISPALDRIVRHCLEKSPGSRFQCAGDAAFDLEAFTGSAAEFPSENPKDRRRVGSSAKTRFRRPRPRPARDRLLGRETRRLSPRAELPARDVSARIDSQRALHAGRRDDSLQRLVERPAERNLLDADRQQRVAALRGPALDASRRLLPRRAGLLDGSPGGPRALT